MHMAPIEGRMKPESNKNNVVPPMKGPAKFPKYHTAEAYPTASALRDFGNISVKHDLQIGDRPLNIPKMNLPTTAFQ